MTHVEAEWIEQLWEATRFRPGHADAWCTLGQALASVGDYDEALTALDRALAINPRYVDASIARCFVRAELESPAAGYALFRELSAASFGSFGVVCALGVFCMRHGWTDTGIGQLRRARRIRPNAAFVGLYLAAALEQVGDTVAANLERCASHRLWKRLLEDAGAPEPAPDPIDSTYYRDWPVPGNVRLHVQHAKHAMMIGDEERAERELSLANARFPGDANLLVETGRLRLLQERLEDAERWFAAAIAVDETCDDAHIELSFLHAEQQRMDAALEHLRCAVDLGPLFPDYRYHLGTLLLDLGRTREAVIELELALALAPWHGHSALQLAASYIALERYDDARELLTTGACRDWSEALVLAAEILSADSRNDDARAVLERLLARDPEHDEARELLARLPG